MSFERPTLPPPYGNAFAYSRLTRLFHNPTQQSERALTRPERDLDGPVEQAMSGGEAACATPAAVVLPDRTVRGVSVMRRSHILTALAASALLAGGQALAQGRGGGHGQGGLGVGLGSQGRGHIGVGVGNQRIDTRTGIDVRTDARVNSQGPANANVRARTRANENSVLRTDLLPPNLVGLRTGLVVRNQTGVRIGTVSRIVTSADGSVRTVLVARDGRRGSIRLGPNTLIVSGDTVTTTAVRLNR